MAQALTNILYGDINPSGKLPVTYPNQPNEQHFSQEQYPGVNHTVNYSEKLNMGYRWYDFHKIEPAYPFGHGLSYTQFDYKNNTLGVSSNKSISLSVQNTGNRFGKEVVQMYLGFPEKSNEPPRLLKGFQKIGLGPNEQKIVQFDLRDRDLSIWNSESHNWEVQTGDFTVYIGSSSRDIRA